jgi:DnaK suppressor protein
MSEELTPTVVAELREQLEQKRDHLLAEVNALRSAEGVTSASGNDPITELQGDEGDSSVELQGWEINRREELNLSNLLADVRLALSKFETGTYGLCEECGRPIPLARLRALPEARYDVAHQAEAEARARRP